MRIGGLFTAGLLVQNQKEIENLLRVVYHICIIFLSVTHYLMVVESACEVTLQTMRQDGLMLRENAKSALCWS